VTIQRIPDGNNLPLDPKQFTFKGLDSPTTDANNELTVTFDSGFTDGQYRICTLSGSFSHQPVIMPVAQRGAQDDCIRIRVGSVPASANVVAPNNPTGNNVAVKGTEGKSGVNGTAVGQTPAKADAQAPVNYGKVPANNNVVNNYGSTPTECVKTTTIRIPRPTECVKTTTIRIPRPTPPASQVKPQPVKLCRARSTSFNKPTKPTAGY
jgi:hypothetical protein